MAIATEKWSKTPSQMELDFKLKAPKIIPAKMAPIVSGSGLPKWIMQYGIIITNIE